MKYVRVVFAVEEQDLQHFDNVLDLFIESTDLAGDIDKAGLLSSAVCGAYVSEPYNDRRSGLGAFFVNKR